MITQKRTANAVGGKTARACESCLKRRARWFCAADDAFLCHACDSSVHSANELAGRHKRVRLEAKQNTLPSSPLPPPPPPPCTTWHQGFTKKARTPRGNPKSSKPSHRSNNYEMRVVPEVSNEEDEGSVGGDDEDRNEAVFSVPNLEDVDQLLIESKGFEEEHIAAAGMDDFNISLIGFEEGDNEWENYLPDGFLQSDIEVAEFAADVESLLENEAGVVGVKGDEEVGDLQLHFPGVKIEEEGDISATTTTNDHCYFDWSIDVETEMFNFDLNTHYVGNDQYQVSGAEEEEENGSRQVLMPKHEAAEVVVEEEEGVGVRNDMEANNSNKRRKILLRLNYDEVINAWASQGCLSPWTTGRRPEFELDHHGWPYCMGGIFHNGVHRQGEEWMGVKGGDEGREARVSRYREKRRTRLFSKKIRYEVRKLNAEKRPRLKGRFVKRTSLSPVGVGVESTFPNYLNK